jgi:prepilin-type N-terminal cleavage/methylation domain-containing protein
MKKREFFKNSKGFTLIELAIVLVIAALLMTMVLKGRDLIRSARMKRDYVNYVERIYSDVIKYSSYVMLKNGYTAVLGDGEVNGGRDESDGFVDYDSTTNIAQYFYNTPTLVNSTQVYAFYPDSSGNYTSLAKLLSIPDIDPEFTEVFKVVPTGDSAGFYFYTSGSKLHKNVRICLGADFKGDKTGNLLLFYDLPLDFAIHLDTIIDGKKNGREGDFLVLGFKLDSNANKYQSATCHCTNTICVGQGIEGGCAFPLESIENVKSLLCGYVIRD